MEIEILTATIVHKAYKNTFIMAFIIFLVICVVFESIRSLSGLIFQNQSQYF